MRRLELLRLHSTRALAGRQRGERRSPRRGGTVEFADFRPYYAGDDFRAVDWAAYARLEQLYIKLFAEEEDLHVYLLIDTSRSMDHGSPNKLDFVKRLAASLSYVALASLDRVAIASYGAGTSMMLAPRRGKHTIFAVIEFLEALRANGSTSLVKTVKELVARRWRPGVIIVITDGLDPNGCVEPLDRLIYHSFQPMVIQVLAPDELAPDLRGDLELVDCEFATAVEVSINDRARRQYQVRLRELLDDIEHTCRRRRVPYVLARSDAPLDSLLLRYLRQAQMLES
jgi:uncharacterized protein (DUF58 family)